MTTSVDADVAAAAYAAEQRRITVAVHRIMVRRAVIEQVKGMLMFIYDMDAEQAFKLLIWRSQTSNIKLVRVAEQLLDDLKSVSSQHHLAAMRAECDRLLLSVDDRVPEAPPITQC